MIDIIVSIILVVIFGGAIFYIYKSKKSGKRCIGCPDSGSCGKSNESDSCSCCSCCHSKDVQN